MSNRISQISVLLLSQLFLLSTIGFAVHECKVSQKSNLFLSQTWLMDGRCCTDHACHPATFAYSSCCSLSDVCCSLDYSVVDADYNLPESTDFDAKIFSFSTLFLSLPAVADFFDFHESQLISSSRLHRFGRPLPIYHFCCLRL